MCNLLAERLKIRRTIFFVFCILSQKVGQKNTHRRNQRFLRKSGCFLAKRANHGYVQSRCDSVDQFLSALIQLCSNISTPINEPVIVTNMYASGLCEET